LVGEKLHRILNVTRTFQNKGEKITAR
jgi:hypothetical protein